MPITTPPAPITWPGSDLEWLVYWALTVPLKKQEGIDFTYQSARFGGKKMYGGIVLHFLMTDGTNIALDIEGEYWHYGQSSELAAAILRRERASTAHIQLIFLDGSDIRRDVVYYTKEALAGVDHSRMAHITGR